MAKVIRLFFRGYVSGLPALSADESTRLGRPVLAEPGSTSCRSVVVAAATDGMSCPSRHGKYHADNEEDDPEDHKKMSEGEGRDEAREQEPENEKDDSESDHDMYLVSADMLGGRSVRCWKASLVLALKRFGAAPPDRRVFRCAAGVVRETCVPDRVD
jgi:hypothetical protein